MEELKKELEKLSKAYVDTPENEEKILIPFIKRLLELPMKDRRKLLPLIRELQWIKADSLVSAVRQPVVRHGHIFYRQYSLYVPTDGRWIWHIM